MWSELASLVENQIRAEQRPEECPAMMALYGALANCQIAFERLENASDSDDPGASSEGAADAVLAMDVVLSTLHNVQPVLGLFDPEPARELARYLHGTAATMSSTTARAQLKDQVETLRQLMAVEVAEGEADDAPFAAFSGARRRLGAFIRERRSADDLFGA